MRKIYLLIASLAAATQVCSAQTDTLFGKWGEAIPAKVKSFTRNGLRVERKMQTVDDKLMNIRYTDLNAIRFADGFEVRFRDGVLVRDNLLSAPSFEESLISVKAEGVLALTPEEIVYLEEPYVPHPLAGVMAQNKPAAAKEKHVWSTGDQKIGK